MAIDLDIAIVGAGIAGLATAIALSKRQARVVVLEQADALTEVGAGLQLSPNGLAVINALGLEVPIRKSGLALDAICLFDGLGGRPLAEIRPKGQYLAVHRADLVGALAKEAAESGVTLNLGQSVQTSSDLDFDLIVGADGIRSGLRRELNAAAEPTFSGQVAWRAVVPAAQEPRPAACVHVGPGRHLVHYPIRGGKQTNIVAIVEQADWTEESWTSTGNPADLAATFGAFDERPRQLLDQVNSAHVWGLFQRPVARNWHDGRRLVLVGDAAHPTLPMMAQGANLALEDAWILPALLDRHGPVHALPAFQRAREKRAERAIALAASNARNYHLKEGPYRLLAHTALRAASRFAPGLLDRRFDWLYGYDPVREFA